MAGAGVLVEREVHVLAGGAALAGNLALPATAGGLILFAHGSGSSRHSPRNRSVARVLRASGLGTLLVDLLTRSEEADDAITGRLRFDIALLARRLTAVTDWVHQEPVTRGLPVGYFGASTGAGAALVAAADRPEVFAVVSRGGRPDLAADALPRVTAPTLLIVGGDDVPVIGMNRAAAALMRGKVRTDIIPGASHLFEEPGALERVGELAARWFEEHLPRAQAAF
jgi:putative phosphoribosyl transferase